MSDLKVILIVSAVALPPLCFLALGLHGLFTRKPFLIATRWTRAIWTSCMIPALVNPFWLDQPTTPRGVILYHLLRWLPAVLLVGYLAWIWLKEMRYSAFGVTEASLKEGLLASLKRMELPCEESLSRIHLPTMDADLKVPAHLRLGIGWIEVNRRERFALLRQVARGMNHYYRTVTVETALGIWQLQIVTSATLLIIILCLASTLWKP